MLKSQLIIKKPFCNDVNTTGDHLLIKEAVKVAFVRLVEHLEHQHL